MRFNITRLVVFSVDHVDSFAEAKKVVDKLDNHIILTSGMNVRLSYPKPEGEAQSSPPISGQQILASAPLAQSWEPHQAPLICEQCNQPSHICCCNPL